MLGTWNAANYNNGETKYFNALNFDGLTVPMLVQGIIRANQAAATNIVNAEGKLNMIALVFSNIVSMEPNLSTVTQGAFASSIVNFSELTGVDTTHKYIRVELVYQTLNLGSIILYNYNYQG